MTVEAIEHITITTGASRMSARREVGDDIVAMIREDIALRGGRLRAAPWRVDLLPAADGGFVFGLRYDAVLIARCWLCVDERLSEDMWDAARSGAIDAGVRLHRPRAAPWLAAALAPDCVTAPREALAEAGDLERCVAWALIE